jgi:hypothetical protein
MKVALNARLSLAVALTLAGSAVATPITITFEGQVHGRIVTNQFAAQGLTSITANNPSRSFDLAAIFDTTRTGTADPDLQDPWDGGNIPANTILRNVLIIAENNTGAGDGVLDNPDDEGNRPAGSLSLQFASPLTYFGFDVVDIEGVVSEASRLEFFSGAANVGTVDFTKFVTNDGNPFYDPTIAFGDNFANRIRPITAASLGAASFDRVVVHLGGSGAIDNLVIPAPSAGAAVIAAGLFASRRRRASGSNA